MSDQQQQNAFEDLSIDQVLELIENGEVTAEEALDIEMQGKNRKTLIGILEKMLTPDPPEEPETVKVIFVRNTKHNRTRYQAGQKVEVSKEDYDVLLAAKVIRLPEE